MTNEEFDEFEQRFGAQYCPESEPLITWEQAIEALVIIGIIIGIILL